MKKFFTYFIFITMFFLNHSVVNAVTINLNDVVTDFFDRTNQVIDRESDRAFDKIFGKDTGSFPQGSFEVPDAPDGVTEQSLKDFIKKSLNFVLGFLGIIAITAIIYAGFLYIIDGGDDDSKEKGKKIIIYVVIGIFVILISYALVNTVIKFESGDAGGGGAGGGWTGGQTGGGGTTAWNNGGMITEQNIANNLRQEIATNPNLYAKTNTETGTAVSTLLPPVTIIVSGEGVEDYGKDVVVPYETAIKGVEFGSSLNAQIIFDFGDGIREGIDTVNKSGSTITHAFGEEKTYFVKAIVMTTEGKIYGIQKNVIVGGIKAIFGISDTKVAIDEQVTLTSRSTSSLGEILHYRWKCKGGEGCFDEKMGKITYVRFSKPGEYQVFHEVENSLSRKAESYDVINVYGKDPVASFIISEVSDSQNPARFKFDASDNYGITGRSIGLTYNWEIDGKKEKTTNPILYHNFETKGDKKISLKVTERASSKTYESETVEQGVTVKSILSVDFTMPSIIQKNQTVTFVANSPLAEEFIWNFGEGEEVYGQMAQHSFTKSGNNTITLKVSKGDDNTELTKKITIINSDRPTAILKIMVNGKEEMGNSVEIARGNSVVFSSDSRDSEDGRNVNLSWFVNGKSVTEPQISSFFQKLGTYQIKLVASDPDNSNLKDEAIVSVVVKNSPPEISAISWQEDSDYGSMQVKVTAEAKDSDGTIRNYRFEALEYGTSVAVQLTDTPEAIFNLNQFPGKHSYFFKVTVTDNDGNLATKTTEQAYEIDSKFKNTAPEISIIPQPGNFGTTETNFLFLSKANDAENDSLNYEWVFPDNKKIYTKDASFRFDTAGSHKVTLNVSDGSEKVSTFLEINVEESKYKSTGNNPPEAKILRICPGLTGNTETIFSFYAEATDHDKDALKYEWVFPDGQKIFLKNVSFKFTKAGSYPVILKVSDGIETVEDSVQITVGGIGTAVSGFELSEGCPPLEEEVLKESAPKDTELIAKSELKDNAVLIETSVDCVKVLESYRVAQVEKLKITTDQYQRDKVIDLLYKINEEIKKCPEHPTEVPKEIRAHLAIESDYITIRGTTNTTFFLYGKILKETESALFFEWNVGDGRKFQGQRVSFKYPKKGLYKVELKISDGLTEMFDYINILIE